MKLEKSLQSDWNTIARIDISVDVFSEETNDNAQKIHCN